MMRWSLHYGNSVTAALYSMREEGQALRKQIIEIANSDQPWLNAIVLPGVPGRYEIECNGYWVGFSVDKERKVLTIFYLEIL